MTGTTALAGLRVIVTGGARGMGASCVLALAAEGARVVSLDVLDDVGWSLAETINAEYPGSVEYIHCDVSSRSEVTSAFEEADRFLSGLDVLVHAAGIERQSPAESISDEEWNLVLGVNLGGTVLVNQAAFPRLRDGGGRIINFASDAALTPYPGGAHYSASKGAVVAWTRTVASEWGKHEITVNCIAPAIWTPMYEEHRARKSPQELADHESYLQANVVLGGKLGDADRDLAPVIVFLSGDGARFITGQIISVNGGLVMVR